MDLPPLVVRADAGPEIGTGHVLRCRALADRWRALGGATTLAAVELPDALAAEWERHGHEVTRLDAPTGFEGAVAAVGAARGWIVADGYHLGSEVVEMARSAGARILVAADHGRGSVAGADIVMDGNAGATAATYWHLSEVVLAGPHFALLRDAVLEARRAGKRRRAGPVTQVLVTLGGSPPESLLTGIVDALLGATPDSVHVAVAPGFSAPTTAALSDRYGKEPRVSLVSPSVLSSAFSTVDLAVTAAGVTAMELACVGVPLITIAVAENQRAGAQALHEAGAAQHLGTSPLRSPSVVAEAVRALSADASARASMSARGRALVDGDGVRRVVAAMVEPLLALRRASRDDARTLWTWANDPATRNASFTTRPIPWEEHVAWLDRALAESSTLLLVAQSLDGRPLGQVRFSGPGPEPEISVALAPEARGRGFGPALIRAACRERMRTMDRADVSIIARVKADNPASIRAFLVAGFRQIGAGRVGDASALVFAARPEHLGFKRLEVERAAEHAHR